MINSQHFGVNSGNVESELSVNYQFNGEKSEYKQSCDDNRNVSCLERSVKGSESVCGRTGDSYVAVIEEGHIRI